jgi:thymidine kinase
MTQLHSIKFASFDMVSGPMFAGKTTRLVARVREALRGSIYHSVVVLKPSLDTREGMVVPPVVRTHDGDEVRDDGEASHVNSAPSQHLHNNPPAASLGISERVVVCPVDDPEWIIGRLPVCVEGKRVFVGVDEVQFFSPRWVSVVLETLLLMRSDVDMVVVGLDMDRDGNRFPGMGSVEEFAAKHQNSVVVEHEKLVGVCAVCNEKNATRTFYKGARDGGQVLIGGSDLYEPRCYHHWLDGS